MKATMPSTTHLPEWPAIGCLVLGLATVACFGDAVQPEITLVVPSFSAMSGGLQHSCGIGLDGEGLCWGFNEDGQLGVGSIFDVEPVLPVVGGLTFTQISSGAEHTCGLLADATVQCWGRNLEGVQRAPQPLPGGLTFTEIEAGALHTCGVATGGAMYCWGLGDNGELGNGDVGPQVETVAPIPVAGGLTFASVTSGEQHTCGVTISGEAYCWGANVTGKLGTGSLADTLTPALVQGGLEWRLVTAGSQHTCGLTVDDLAYCWGDNRLDQIGTTVVGETCELSGITGSAAQCTTPQPVGGGLRWASLSAGEQFTCGITDSGEAYCWGRNQFGQLGIGSFRNAVEPALVSGNLLFTQLNAGGRHACGVISTAEGYCWGLNERGQLGLIGSEALRIPKRVEIFER